MDHTPSLIVEMRDVFAAGADALVYQMLQLVDFTDLQSVSTTYSTSMERTFATAAAKYGVDPLALGEFVRRASVQTACWILDKTLSGIPSPVVARVSLDVWRHEFLSILQLHLGDGSEPNNLASRLTKLIAETAPDQHLLKVRARFMARRARSGFYTRPDAVDVESVCKSITKSFPELRLSAELIAGTALDKACQWIYILAHERFSRGEFELPTEFLPSTFVAEAAYYRFRHILLSTIEDRLG